MLPLLTLVLGGASSGKSDLAERLVVATGRPRTYVATAQAFDPEMEAKIAAHRDSRGAGWQTLEAPHDLAGAIAALEPGRVVLVDCATMWITNRLLGGHDVAGDFAPTLDALEGCPSPVVLVSNEVGQGIVPENRLSRRFRDLQGRFNREAAARAGLVVTVMAGLPLVLKGEMPEEGTW